MTVEKVLLSKIEELEKENKNLKECNTMLANLLIKECPNFREAVANVFKSLSDGLSKKTQESEDTE